MKNEKPNIISDEAFNEIRDSEQVIKIDKLWNTLRKKGGRSEFVFSSSGKGKSIFEKIVNQINGKVKIDLKELSNSELLEYRDIVIDFVGKDDDFTKKIEEEIKAREVN